MVLLISHKNPTSYITKCTKIFKTIFVDEYIITKLCNQCHKELTDVKDNIEKEKMA